MVEMTDFKKELERQVKDLRKDMEQQNQHLRKDMEQQNQALRKEREQQNQVLRKDMDHGFKLVEKEFEISRKESQKEMQRIVDSSRVRFEAVDHQLQRMDQKMDSQFEYLKNALAPLRSLPERVARLEGRAEIAPAVQPS